MRVRRVVALGAVLATLAVVLVVGVTMGCSSTGPRDLVGRGREALAATQAAAAADLPAEVVDASLARFLNLFETFEPAAVREAALGLYAERAYFNDGFVELEGNQTIAAYLERTATATRSLEVEVEDVDRRGGEVYVRWVMTFTTVRKSTTIVAPGISHLRFDPAGRVVYHRDYWDGSGALAELVPLVGPVLRAVRARL
jgi:limonene-1,2-epoxide hydrolase